ncbi:MAG: hypothetical protein WCG75_08000 [Armatimonadota bacterium]
MKKDLFSRFRLMLAVGCVALVSGCEPIKKTPEDTSNNAPLTSSQVPDLSSNKPQPAVSPDDLAKRKEQFELMQKSIQAVAAQATSKKGPEFDFQFVLPSEAWEKTSHGMGDRKSSVWLFTDKPTGMKILVSCAGTSDDPNFAKSALAVYESSHKNRPEVTREWKVGEFDLKRSFIGFIDPRHGEVTISAFSPVCTLEFNIASETMDRDDLFKYADEAVESFMKKNPKGGFPAK